MLVGVPSWRRHWCVEKGLKKVHVTVWCFFILGNTVHEYTFPTEQNCMLRHGKVAIKGLRHHRWIMNISFKGIKNLFLLDSLNSLLIIKILPDAIFTKLVAAYRKPPMTLKIVLTATYMSLKNYSESSLMTNIGKNRPMREKESRI